MIVNYYNNLILLFTAHFLIIDFVRIQSPPTSEVVNETDSLTLHCIATGLPVPMIIWTKEPPPLDPDNPSSPVLPPGYSVSTSEPLQGDNGVYQVSSVLSVPSVRYSDRGTYTCTASNTGPFDQSLFSNESVSHEVTVQSRFNYISLLSSLECLAWQRNKMNTVNLPKL